MDSAFIKKEIIKRDILIEQIKNGKNEISEYLDKIKNENNSKYNILDNYFEQLEKLLQIK